MTIFRYSGYTEFFEECLCDEGEDLSKYASLFDFREPASIKRRELSGGREMRRSGDEGRV
jgi:hypothetical protein